MLAGPELARVKEFEVQYLSVCQDEPQNQHHQHNLSTQKAYQKHVNSLVTTMNRMGNPFLDIFKELVTIDSRNCVFKIFKKTYIRKS